MSRRVLPVLVILASTPFANAAVKVNGVPQVPINGKYEISLTASVPNESYDITANAGDQISYVRVNNPFPSSAVTLSIYEELFSQGVGFLGEVSVSGLGELWLGVVRVNGDVGAPSLAPGSRIEVHHLELLDVTGTVYAPLKALPSAFGTSVFNSISIGGDLRNDVLNPYGSVFYINVLGDIEGSATDLVNIFASKLCFDIRADDMRHIEIGGVAGNPPGSVSPTMLVRTGVFARGEFLGSLSCYAISTLAIDGNAEGTFVLGTALQPTFDVERVLIGGSLVAGSQMVLIPPASPVTTAATPQMVVNNLLSGGQWLGEVRVRPANDPLTVLLANPGAGLPTSAPEYSPALPDLNQLAIGEAGFRVQGTVAELELTQGGVTTTYVEASPNAIIVKPASTAPETMNLRIPFYGFLDRSNLTDAPATYLIERVRFERRPFDGAWEDHSTPLKFRWFSPQQNFGPSRVIEMRGQPANTAAPVGPGNPELPTTGYHFWNGYQYRLKPNTEFNLAPSCVLYQAADPGSPIVSTTVESTDEIRICVGTSCAADFNADGFVNGADLSVLLSNFGTTIPFGGAQTADVNGDNTVNGLDLSVLLATFQATCAPCAEAVWATEAESEGLMAGGFASQSFETTLLPAELASLGFESIDQYVSYVESLNEEELAVHALIVHARFNGN